MLNEVKAVSEDSRKGCYFPEMRAVEHRNGYHDTPGLEKKSCNIGPRAVPPAARQNGLPRCNQLSPLDLRSRADVFLPQMDHGKGGFACETQNHTDERKAKGKTICEGAGSPQGNQQRRKTPQIQSHQKHHHEIDSKKT